MTKIPIKVRKEIANDPTYRVCKLEGHHGHICGGRITMEHAIIYAGRQIQEKWAIVSICARGQEVDQFQDAHTMNKELNQWVAFNQATDEELQAFKKASIPYISQRERLNRKYGIWKLPGAKTLWPESDINYAIIGLNI